MKKNIFGIAIILISFLSFSAYIKMSQLNYEVIDIISPTKIVVDFNKNQSIDNNETVCINNINSFEINPKQAKINELSQKFNLSYEDIIGLGYLSKEYSYKTLFNQKVTVKKTNNSNECINADVYMGGINYKDILLNSGFGIINNKIGNINNYKIQLEKAKKLNLVIYNHKSNKYHHLNCEYGKMAKDYVIIPKKQLPKEAKPCKVCHEINNSLKKINKKDKNEILISYKKVNKPNLTISSGDITLLISDFYNHYSPNKLCNTKECQNLISLIKSAQKSIDIAIYGYEEIPLITQYLHDANKRGVKIRFVYDIQSDKGDSYYSCNNKIIELSTQYNNDKGQNVSNIMHNKFLIFDNNIVFTGSMNFSPSGLSRYDGNDTIIIKSESVAELYTKEFEQLLNGKNHINKSSVTTKNNKFSIGDSTIEVFFSPKDKTATRISEIINKADNYIYIPAFLITHKNISQNLVNAKNRGVDVKIILDANSSSTRNTKHKYLRENKIPIKFENFAGKLHSKTMIVDDKYIIMGSMNFSNSGENKNDENTLIICNPKFARMYKQFFLYLWSIIPDKYLHQVVRAESPESIGSCYDGVDNNFNGKIDMYDENCASLKK